MGASLNLMDLTLFSLHLSSYHGSLECVSELGEVGMLLVAVIDPWRVRFA